MSMRARAVAAYACAALLLPPAAAGQLAGGGFVPAVAPHTVAQAPLLAAGWSAWGDAAGPAVRADAWFGRIGAAAGVARPGAGRGAQAAGVVMLEVLAQGVAPRRPGVQVQAAYTRMDDGDGTGARAVVPVSAGIFLNVPPPLPGRRHALLHPALIVTHELAGGGGTRAGMSVRMLLSDAGALTHWGVHGYARLYAARAAPRPRWEVAVARLLR